MRITLVGDDWQKKCIVIYDCISTGSFTHEGERLLVIARFNIYPKGSYDDMFLSICKSGKIK